MMPSHVFLVNGSWHEHLLRLAMDVARGMAYMHGRSYFDEADMTSKNCVLHRDLKVPPAFLIFSSVQA